MTAHVEALRKPRGSLLVRAREQVATTVELLAVRRSSTLREYRIVMQGIKVVVKAVHH